VPTFFSAKPEDTLRQLQQDPEYAFECLQALISKLIARRELSREEAEAYYPDPREGDFKRILKRGWQSPASKKASSEEKGMYIIKCITKFILMTKCATLVCRRIGRRFPQSVR